MSVLVHTFSQMVVIDSTIGMVDRHRPSGSLPDIALVLANLRGMRASDPRDQVYAALSMDDGGYLVEVDYRKTVARVFTVVLLARLPTEHAENIFGYCQLGSTLRNLSSWAPDRSQPASRFLLPKIGLTVTLIDMQKQVYNAGRKELGVSATYYETETLLAMRGCMTDEGLFAAASLQPNWDDLFPSQVSLSDVTLFSRAREQKASEYKKQQAVWL